MDDIILIADSPRMLQQMLTITEKFAHKWHFCFSFDKCKIMTIGSNIKFNWNLNGVVLDLCDTYVYLGEAIKNDLTMLSHVARIKQKAFSNFYIIEAISKNEVMAKLEMKTFLQLYNTCLIKAVLYNAETWTLQDDELRELESTQNSIIRLILKAPKSTPILALYSELGILPIKFQIMKQQLMYFWKAVNSKTIVSNIKLLVRKN